MSSTHGGSPDLVVSGMIALLKAQLPTYLAEENSRITGDFDGPTAPLDSIGYMDDVFPSRPNVNTIRVFCDSDDQITQLQGSVNEDGYYLCKVGVVWQFSPSLEMLGTWKRTMYQAIKRAVLGNWIPYLGPASAYHVSIVGDMRSGSPRQQGTKSSNVFTALEAAMGSNVDTITAIFNVRYVFSEDVSF